MTSTLSAYAVVTQWVEEHAADTNFPMEAFNRAISYDIRGHQVLLQHIMYLKSIWHSSWPAVRSQRRRLYFEELNPSLERDLRRVQKLILFSRAEVGVFARDLSRKSSLAASTNMTFDLLQQALSMIQLLIAEINAFFEDDRNKKEKLLDEASDRDILPPCRPVQPHTREHTGRPNVTLRIPQLEAKQILMKKPTGSPTLVVCSSPQSSRCTHCLRRSCRCWEPKRAARSDSVISFNPAR